MCKCVNCKLLYLGNAQECLDFLCPERSSLANEQLAHPCGFDVTVTLFVDRAERLIKAAAAKRTTAGKTVNLSV